MHTRTRARAHTHTHTHTHTTAGSISSFTMAPLTSVDHTLILQLERHQVDAGLGWFAHTPARAGRGRSRRGRARGALPWWTSWLYTAHKGLCSAGSLCVTRRVIRVREPKSVLMHALHNLWAVGTTYHLRATQAHQGQPTTMPRITTSMILMPLALVVASSGQCRVNSRTTSARARLLLRLNLGLPLQLSTATSSLQPRTDVETHSLAVAVDAARAGTVVLV